MESSLPNLSMTSLPLKERITNWQVGASIGFFALKCSNKLKFFIWLCYHSRLPTKSYLNHIGVVVDPLCPKCHSPETTKHIFLECNRAKKFWRKHNIEFAILNIALSTDENWLEELRILRTSLPKMLITWTQFFSFMLWYIWIPRNSNIFNQRDFEISPMTPYERAVEFISLTKKEKQYMKRVTADHTWKPPTMGVKLNIDGSYQYNTKKGDADGVFRDTKGNWLLGFSASITLPTHLMLKQWSLSWASI